MLRPATPLTALLLLAFVLLLLSVISVPVTNFVPMGKFKDVTFGVFGFCKDGAQCSPIGIGYDTDKLLDNENQAFQLPVSIRNSVSAILVVHPVAALLAFTMFIMAAASHFHSPAHSSRYLLVLLIFILITFLLCLLAFLVDVLLFIPHMSWGSYMVLAATILLGVSFAASCVMRRTLVSRKASRNRVAENAEMSGENYYNREGQFKAASISVAPTQPTLPFVSGGNPGAGAQFARFDEPRKDDQVSDERIPLTQRSPSERSPHAIPNDLANTALRSPSRDPYGNPANGPPGGYPGRGGRADVSPGGGYRGGGGGGYGRGGFDNYSAPMRGRGGGFGPPGRGGPRGGRAGYGPAPRGDHGMRGGRGPSPNYNNAPGHWDRRPPADAPYRGQQPPLPESSLDPSWNASNNAPTPSPRAGYQPYNPDGDLPRAESPPPLAGGAIEMDATPPQAGNTFSHYGQVRDSDLDVVGMVGLQQGRPPGRHDTVMSDMSRYSTDDVYVPPRTGWNQNSGRNSPRAERSGQRTPPANAPPPGGYYYEDADAQYAAPMRPNNNVPPPTEPLYEDVHATRGGARSPAESERSNLTSISQRGVNPRWNPNHPPMPRLQGAGPRRQVQQQQRRQDVLLDNPDFQLPGSRSKGAQRGAYPPNAL